MSPRPAMVFLVLALAGLPFAGGCSKPEEYPLAVQNEYLSSCQASAREANGRRPEADRMDDAAIERFCRCTWEGVRQSIPLREFMAYENAVNLGGAPDPQVTRKLSELAVPCQMQLLKAK